MSVQINYNNIVKELLTMSFSLWMKGSIFWLKKYISNSDYYYTQDLLKTKDLKKN